MKYTAFIFARGESKGIKNKNIRKIGGIPLIINAINCAYDSKYINRVIVSTDSAKIAKLSIDNGAEIISRPKNLARDDTPELLAWQHAIKAHHKNFSTNKSPFISIPTTSPLRLPCDIDNAINKFNKSNYDLILGVSPSKKSPLFNMVYLTKNNHLSLFNEGKNIFRRQDSPLFFDITTSVYVASVEYLMKCDSILEGKVGHVIVPQDRAIDIDDYYDLHIANLLYENKFSKK